MKAILGTIFGFLTAAAIAGGVLLGLRNRRQHMDFLEERRALQTELARLEADVTGWEGLPEDAERVEVEMDSLRDTLQVLEVGLEERLARKGSLNRQPRVTIGEVQEGGAWRVYPFSLAIEGNPESVDSFIVSLKDDLPLVRFDKLNARLAGNKLKLELTGSVRFPK